jgi:hypothetical protein
MELVGILRVVHILTAILMAWPAYALVAVSQRRRLGSPLGDRADVYFENMIKSRVVPCYVFQLTALVTGLGLLVATGLGLGALVTNWLIGAKFVLLLLIIILLSVVNFRIQPRIDGLFAQASGSTVLEPEASQIRALRATRTRVASICMFSVLTISMLGVQALAPFPLWLTAVFVLLIAAFTRRTYSSVTPYGWV